MHHSGGHDLTFVSVLPRLSPATELGANSVATYAARQGVDAAAFTKWTGPALTPSRSARRS